MFFVFLCGRQRFDCISMKNTPRRRRTVTSSLNEISTDQLGNGVVVRGGRCFPPAHAPLKDLPDRYKDDMIGLSTKYVYIKSTTVYVPSSELGLSQPLSQSLASECALPPEPGRGPTRLLVRGWGSPNFDDLWKSLPLCLLCGFFPSSRIFASWY